MIKIVYAAGNSLNSKIQLKRFLNAIKNKNYRIKVAAYKKSSPVNTNIDWTLDALLDFRKPSRFTFDSDNFQTFYDQVKAFSPDLIISDLEHFSSYIANQLGCILWQYSSIYIYHALERHYKEAMAFKRHYREAMTAEPNYEQTIKNLILNSDKNYICSHFGDVPNPPQIASNFEWVRPYHQIGKISKPCKHNIVAGMSNNHKPILNALNQNEDCVAFTDGCIEYYRNIVIKPFINEEEYYCNLKNCSLMVSQGQTTFLSDAYYNGKFSALYLDYSDMECVTNGMISDKLFFSKTMPINGDKLDDFLNIDHEPKYNSGIDMIHKKIENLSIYKTQEL